MSGLSSRPDCSGPAITRPVRWLYYSVKRRRSEGDAAITQTKASWLRIRRMQVREAKDFLVRETAEQARLEGVPLSELEKRMMYFTESGYVPEDPIALNEEFEAEYDTDDYEAKIAHLLGHAYKRARKENDETRRHFDAAIKCLRRGDHYLLVMWDMRPGFHGPYLIGLLLGALVLACFYAATRLAPRIAPPNPRIIQAILVTVILVVVFFPQAVGKAFDWVLENTVERFMGGSKSED